MSTAPVLLVIAGPAGSGKSTLCDRLVLEEPGFSRVVTTTTRAPRPGEVNGVHYHFFSPAEFEAKVQAGEFLEWAWVHANQSQNREQRRYGTLKSSVLDPLQRGRDTVLSVDVQGVESFRAAARTTPLLARAMTTIFIVVDHERLVARMQGRAETDAEIAARMRTAESELREAHKFDFTIESRTRDEDFAALKAILAKARERAARG